MVEGKRRKGRPAAGWLDDIKEWTGLTVTNASRLANDRRRWKALIQTTPALFGAIWLEREMDQSSIICNASTFFSNGGTQHRSLIHFVNRLRVYWRSGTSKTSTVWDLTIPIEKARPTFDLRVDVKSPINNLHWGLLFIWCIYNTESNVPSQSGPYPL